MGSNFQGPSKGGWGLVGVFLSLRGRFLTTFLKVELFRILKFFLDSRFLKNFQNLNNSTFQKSCQKSTPMAQKHPHYVPTTFRGSLEPINNFLALYLNFSDFHLFLLLRSGISSTLENRVFRSDPPRSG